MAGEAARLVAADFVRLVVEPLIAPGDPAARLRKAVAGLDRFYRGGEEACLIEHFSVPDAAAATPSASRQMAEAALSGFAAVARAAGASRKVANALAERALVDIQGALVLSRALGDRKPFLNALKGLPGVLLAG